jgi:hypothetical protein
LLPEHDGRQGFNGYMACSNKAQSLWSGAGGEVQDWLAVDWFATVRQLDLLAGMALSLDGVRVELASAIPLKPNRRLEWAPESWWIRSS